jgi:hypothetical protein
MMEGLRTDEETVTKVVTLLSYGCPIQAIVHAFDLDERTVAEWQKRAGEHCEQVHHAIIEQGNVKSQHIQADEIRAKGRKMISLYGLRDRCENALMDGRDREYEPRSQTH